MESIYCIIKNATNNIEIYFFKKIKMLAFPRNFNIFIYNLCKVELLKHVH